MTHAYVGAMYRSLLLALDDTRGAVAARDLAFGIARRTGARLTALSVFDRPHTTGLHEAVPLGGAAFAERRNQARAAAIAAEAERVLADCAASAGGVPFEVVRSEDAPEAALLAEGAGHDLVIIGRDSTLGAEICDDGLSPTVEALLRDGPRPLLVVPPGPMPPADAPVLVAFEGSMPDMRTVQLFALSGLAGASPIKVLGFGADAAAKAARVARYLESHACRVEHHAVAGDEAEIALVEARTLPASMLVTGADEEAGLARLIWGGRTAHLLRASPCPVFIHG
ncbi:MAG: universal stress protein [Acetobacteraceae bacterium]|nr:universal stress protein [Acetobacteraceae bacterium]